jgi:phenylacetate-CoA ligase
MIYQALYKSIIYPAYHWALSDGANAAIRELDRNELRSSDSLRRHERQKLQSLLSFAVRNVPYYRNLANSLDMTAAEFSDPRNLPAIPILSKTIINTHRDDLISEDLTGNGLDKNSTGGSTGEVLKFYTDRRSGSYRKATVRRNKRWVGIQPGDREVRLWGAPLDVGQSRSMRGRIHAAITRERLLSADTLDETSLGSYLAFCKSFKPRLMVAYPSALVEFGRYCERQSARIESLKAVICSAESLLTHDREYIEKVFGIPVYDRYGCREVGDIAQEAPGVSGLLVNSDRIHVEIVDDEGNLCAPGEQGEVIVTDLDNFGMPLIRYRIGDYARWSTDEDAGTSAYPFPVLASVDGRTLDVVRSPGGQRVGGTYWTMLLRNRPGMRRFQVIQDELSRIKVLYEPETGVQPDFDFLRAEVVKSCGAEMSVEFIETSQFEHAPGTKFRLVISQVSE